ncbi:dihydrolipoamide acetyltransferase family protein [Alteribacillus sp. YIM 98480]|uniref:dihydrolipoamide acetyltransferase family protein n=1 Tax=Alteribacillus sp. YIM 98480 TaxID=2606599 RepID=UPI00131C4BE3|nr:dihydrolipoamide acetyltransferase family protein [Alteribacillus sp. YIM 98480]
MATEVLMPKLGATMESGTIVNWFKEVGDSVNVGEPLVEVMTDKINIEVEANIKGILISKQGKQDEEIPVNQVIAYIGEEGESISPAPKEKSTNQISQDSTNTNLEGKGNATLQVESQVERDNRNKKVRRTPAARRVAIEENVSLLEINGTGPNGRIQENDVLKYIKQQQEVKATPLASKIAAERDVDLKNIEGTGANGKVMRADIPNKVEEVQIKRDEEPISKKLTGIRKVVAQRMVESVKNVPHVTLVNKVDMSNSIALRKQLLPTVEKQTGFRISYSEIIMKAVSTSLLSHPEVNVSLSKDEILVHENVNVGFATAVDHGLVVPVVRDVDTKGLATLTTDAKQLIDLARKNQLKQEQMTGGTFTISNLGMYAVEAFTPIINQPQSAILGVGSINEEGVGVNGVLKLRPMMSLSLSFDHRVIDGAPAAAFLTTLKEILENPYQMLV